MLRNDVACNSICLSACSFEVLNPFLWSNLQRNFESSSKRESFHLNFFHLDSQFAIQKLTFQGDSTSRNCCSGLNLPAVKRKLFNEWNKNEEEEAFHLFADWYMWKWFVLMSRLSKDERKDALNGELIILPFGVTSFRFIFRKSVRCDEFTAVCGQHNSH